MLQFTLLSAAQMFVLVSLVLLVLVSSSMVRPFKSIVQVLHHIRKGRFDRRVRVTSNDEIGYTGDAINQMIDGLIERDKMRQSLDLAREVQQQLLPQEPLHNNGCHIAGRTLYCEKTGGDYYDYFRPNSGDIVHVAVGDVVGHGISSALLMAVVRSSLRQRAALPGSVAQILTDVNRQLCGDVGDSGQFVTLFLLALDWEHNGIEWVRAGHDPAWLYDPESDSFSELGGQGMALGLRHNSKFQESRLDMPPPGQVVFLGTDGIWEAQNPQGVMLGKDPVRQIIREHHDQGAQATLDALFQCLEDHCQTLEKADDITAVVIKIGKA